MGNEIVYCRNCQTRLLNSDFERGAAFKIDGIASCDQCAADVLKLLPPDKFQEFLHQTAKSKKAPPAPEKAAPRAENRRGTGSIPIVPAVPKTERALGRKKGLGPAGWSGVAVGAAGIIILILVIGRESSSEAPADVSPAPRKPAPVVATDLAELDKRVKEFSDRQDYGGALAVIEASRARHGTLEWTGSLERKSKELLNTAFRASTAMKDKAIEARRKGAEEEVKALREQIAKLGMPELLADFDRAIKPKDGAETVKAPRARIVRIENPGPILSLAEVQVFSGSENVALKGTASQISTSLGGYANRAIDGNTNGNWGANSTTHTDGGKVPTWWEVDLGAVVPIDRVVVWNRTDGDLGYRLQGYSVLLLDEARTLVASRKDEPSPNPSAEHVFGPPAKPTK